MASVSTSTVINDRQGYGSRQQAEVLASLEDTVRALISMHEEKRELWFPSDLLSYETEQVHELRERARNISDAARVSLALILLTEEGLPHFHRLVATYLGEDSFWQEWNNLWTAEEDRHGNVVRDYCRATSVLDMGSLERLQFAYLRNGFRNRYRRDPYTLFVYTTFQERATQIAHARTAEAVSRAEPALNAILLRISAEEARHFAFYRRVFGEILNLDPNGALESLALAARVFDMPGRTIPGFSDMSEVVRRAGIYGPHDYVSMVADQLRFWNIDSVQGLDDQGKRRQEEILDLPRNLAKFADSLDKHTQPRSFSFDILHNRSLEM